MEVRICYKDILITLLTWACGAQQQCYPSLRALIPQACQFVDPDLRVGHLADHLSTRPSERSRFSEFEEGKRHTHFHVLWFNDNFAVTFQYDCGCNELHEIKPHVF
jgi:hypothetical protein